MQFYFVSIREGLAVKILVTGSTGLIGRSVIPALTGLGNDVVALPRRRDSGTGWNPVTGDVDLASIDGANAVLHLAGAGIADRRWTDARKRLIAESRSGPTTALAKFLATCARPPHTLIVASAIGIYGDRGDAWLDESAVPGDGFLAGVVRDWEAATIPAVEGGIRVVNLRFGIILTAEGGALKRMLLPFRLGLGGPIGNGRQYWSWVGLDDVIGSIRHALETTTLSGPVNVVSPNPVSNRAFTSALGRVLSRPAFLPLPRFAVRLALGEMADELLLNSARVRPAMLASTGYQFRDTDLHGCLHRLLKS